MDIPQSVIEAVRAATIANLRDVSAAIPAAVAAVRALPDFDEVCAALVDHAVQELVYRERGSLNASIAREAAYTGPPKVNVAASEAVQRVAESVYNLSMGGKRLGDLTGLELDAVAEGEDEKARGHAVNAALARWCRGKVADEQSVRKAIPLAELRRAYVRIQKQHGRGEGRAAA